MQQKLIKYIGVLAYTAGTIGGIWLGAKYLLPWAAPFILAYAVAALLELPMGFLLRHVWRRSPAAAVLTLAVLGLLSWAVVSLSLWAINAATDFAKQTPALMLEVGDSLGSLQNGILLYVDAAPEGVKEYMETALDSTTCRCCCPNGPLTG